MNWRLAEGFALRGSASSTFRGPALLQLQPNPLTSLQFVPQFSASYFTADVVYRVTLPSNLAITAAVFNVADRDPPSVRLTDYNYDPSFGNPIGRVFKVGVSKEFR